MYSTQTPAFILKDQTHCILLLKKSDIGPFMFFSYAFFSFLFNYFIYVLQVELNIYLAIHFYGTFKVLVFHATLLWNTCAQSGKKFLNFYVMLCFTLYCLWERMYFCPNIKLIFCHLKLHYAIFILFKPSCSVWFTLSFLALTIPLGRRLSETRHTTPEINCSSLDFFFHLYLHRHCREDFGCDLTNFKCFSLIKM